MLSSLKTKKKKSTTKKKKAKDKSDRGDADAASSRAKTDINEAPEGEYSYKHMLDRIYMELRANNPDLVNKKRAVLQPPIVERVGTSKIVWKNFPDICKMMKRDPDHVFRFFL